MQTLFIISVSAFVIAALAWFGTWAFWLHPPEGWLGKELVSETPLRENDRVRHAPWFRWLKLVTLLLGLITSTLFVALLRAHTL
jgi:quinol-cytochrome oxidoreductase complex cytochrome b subunit